jgi:hypothetical protein
MNIPKIFRSKTVKVDRERLKELEYRSAKLREVINFYDTFGDAGELQVNLELILQDVREKN